MATGIGCEPDLELPEDLAAYVAQHGLAGEVLATWEMTRQVFPLAQKLEVYLEPDPDIPKLWFIVYEVQVAGYEVEQMVEADNQWVTRSMKLFKAGPVNNHVLRLLSID